MIRDEEVQSKGAALAAPISACAHKTRSTPPPLPAPRSGERLCGRVDLVVVAAGGEEGELGEGAGGLVRQKNKTVLDRRLGMEAHDLVGRQTAETFHLSEHSSRAIECREST